MSVWVVQTRPVPALYADGLAEAGRALGHQGLAPSADALQRGLWAIRSLPLALDCLADARASVDLGRTRLRPRSVLAQAPLSGDPVAMTALFEAGADSVEVRVASSSFAAADEAVAREEAAWVIVFGLERAPSGTDDAEEAPAADDDDSTEDTAPVVVRRFAARAGPLGEDDDPQA